MSNLTGDMSTRYGVFAADAESALDGLNGADDGLGGALDHAALGDRSGRAASGAVLAGAGTDTASLAPVSGTPAGQRALIAALRARVAQQHQVVAAYRARDAQLARLLRSLSYARASAGTALAPSGRQRVWASGMPGGGGLLSGLSGLTGTPTRRHRPPRAALVSRVDHRADAVPGGPGEVAVARRPGQTGSTVRVGSQGAQQL